MRFRSNVRSDFINEAQGLLVGHEQIAEFSLKEDERLYRQTDSRKTPKLTFPVEIRFLLPSPPWFETFQVAFL